MQHTWVTLTVIAAVSSCFMLLSSLGIRQASESVNTLDVERISSHYASRSDTLHWGDGQRSAHRVNVRSQR